MSASSQNIQLSQGPVNTPIAYVRVPKDKFDVRGISEDSEIDTVHHKTQFVHIPNVKRSDKDSTPDYTELIQSILDCDWDAGDCSPYFQKTKEIDSRNRMGFLFDVTKVAAKMKNDGDSRGDELSDKIQYVETLWGQDYVKEQKD